ncbi:helix-turn-helix domain-containing protein [Segatella sp.]|uniref:helix-turn-helix domain-containing protein n=1 Tax=Segatella sp. TaxID=2974253 RepID=UPI003AB96D60
MHAKLRKKQYSKAKNQEKSQKLIIFYKKNNILYLFLRNLDSFVNFVGKVQYNILLGMKIQEVMILQRKALGITQQDLADMSEVAISTIKQIESGKGNPSLSTVEKIMDILGMEVKYEIRQTVQTRRSNFQQNIKEVNIG